MGVKLYLLLMRCDVVLTLEIPASLSFYDGNLSLINLFDSKFSVPVLGSFFQTIEQSCKVVGSITIHTFIFVFYLLFLSGFYATAVFIL